MRDRRFGRATLERRLRVVAVAVALSSLAIIACASPTAQATDPTSIPTATPASMGEEQAVAEPTHTPTATPTPASSEGQESGSDPEPTSTPTPTSTPVPSEPVSGSGLSATTTPAVTTTEEVAAGPPLGDCYGGALSEDPIICYVVKRAEAEGLIDVLGVYEGGGGLYVSISQELTQEFVGFSFFEMRTFYQNWPELLPKEKYAPTLGRPCSAFPECYLWPLWQSSHAAWDQREVLPAPSRYQWAQFVPDGEPGRRDIPGWASWRQLWPRVSAEEGMAGGTGGGPAFDVSDVDVTNFPEIDGNVCAHVFYGIACSWWLDFPDMGIAGAHGGGITYFQIKSPPTDEAELEAIRRRISPCYDVVGRCTYTDEKSGRRTSEFREATSTIEIVPVKYDYQDLWRWAIVLDRFALSAANTIGIVDAYVSWNRVYTGGFVTYPLVYLNGLSAESGPADIRETIWVVTHGDQQTVADALPTLLPLLGIPVDAVGVVHRS